MRRVVPLLAPVGLVCLAVFVAASAKLELPPSPAEPVVRCAMSQPAPPIALADRSMTPLCDDVYVEPDLPEPAAPSLKRDYERARLDLVAAFDHDLRSTPVVLFCQSAACKVAFGAPRAAASATDLGFASATATSPSGEPIARSLVVVSGPFPRTSQVLTHELVHAEMKARTSYESLPTWFNEGVATYIAGEPPCEGIPSPAVDVRTLSTKEKWQAHLGKHHDTHPVYCASRDHVARWLEGSGNARQRATTLKALLSAVKDGTPFERAFAP